MRPVLRRVYRALGFPAHLTDDELMFTTLDAAATDFVEHRKNLRAISQPSLVAWASDDMRYAKGGHNLQKTRATEIANSLREFCS